MSKCQIITVFNIQKQAWLTITSSLVKQPEQADKLA